VQITLKKYFNFYRRKEMITVELTKEEAEEVLEALHYHGYDHDDVIAQINEQLKFTKCEGGS
jgi:hypothetical protein